MSARNKSFNEWWQDEQRRTQPPQLPQPRKPAEREAAPAPVATPTASTESLLVRQLREAAESGRAGYLWLDWDKLAPALSDVIAEFNAAEHHAREGRGRAAVVLTVGRNGPRTIALQISGPARERQERFEPERGGEADITNPAVLERIRREAVEVRDSPTTAHLPALVILTPEVVPLGTLDRELRDRLDKLAAEARCCVAVVADHPSYAPKGRAKIVWCSKLDCVPWIGDFHDAGA